MPAHAPLAPDGAAPSQLQPGEIPQLPFALVKCRLRDSDYTVMIREQDIDPSKHERVPAES